MDIDRILTNLKRRRYEAHYFNTKEEAMDYLAAELKGRTIGLGDSATLAAMGAYDRLSQENDVVDPVHPLPSEKFRDVAKRTLLREIFISSANAMSEQGEIVNIDGTGNRVAGTLFGSETVYFVIGINKIRPTLEEAIYRARNIAAPLNSKRKYPDNPCARAPEMKCYDCSATDRICNAMTIHFKKMRNTKAMEVLIIGEELGF